MKLTSIALKRPVALLMCVLCIFVLGFNGFMNMPMELTPEIEMPMFVVSTSYPGAGPEDVEAEVTSVLEDALSTIEGLKNISSNSNENYSSVMLELDYGVDTDEANDDIQDKINRIKGALPDEADVPTVMKFSMDNSVVAALTVCSDTYPALRNYVDDEIIPVFEKIKGVASVDVMGGDSKYVKVQLDNTKMQQYNTSFSTISQLISLTSLNIPAGSIERDDQTLLLRGEVKYDTVEQLKTMPITLNSGNVISLEDIANVTLQDKEADSISRINGEEGIILIVNKSQDSNTVGVSDDVVDTVDQLNALNENVSMDVFQAAGEYIKSSIFNVAASLIAGALISMVVLWFFLGDLKASMIVAASMPLSIIATFALMHFAGLNINLVSLGGLVIGVGMIVDNSIVVLESMYRIKSKGLPHEEAANEGVRIVGSAIVASTLTTVIVFLPISLIKGLTGQLFRQAGFTVVFSLLTSLITAVTIVPVLFNKIQPQEKMSGGTINFVKKIEKRYKNVIVWALNHRKTVLGVTSGLLVGAIALIPIVGFELMPSMDEGMVQVSITGKNGLRVEELNKVVRYIEDEVVDMEDVELIYTTSSDGGSGEVNMTLKDDRTMSTNEVCDHVRDITKDIVGYDIEVESASMSGSMGGGGGNSMQIKIKGKDLKQLEKASYMIADVMESYDEVISAKSSASSGNPEAKIVVDPLKAAAYGMNPASVISTVSQFVQGSSVSDMTIDGIKYDVRLEYPKDEYSNIENLTSIMVPSPSGISVPLIDVANIVYDNGPTTISRENNQYNVSISGQVASNENSFAVQQKVMGEIRTLQLPEGTSIMAGGSNDTMIEEFSAIANALWLSVVLVFMIMAAQFESTRFSLIVMATVPFSLIGAILSLFLTGKTISMTSFVGIVMLVGMVINNSIVLIDYAGQLRRDCGMSTYDALVEAGMCRIRPILMSTLTTVMGMVPMAIGIGDGSEMMQSMALVVMGGLLFSTLLTLIFIPVVYLVAENRRDKKREKKRIKREQKKLKAEQA